MKGNQILNSRTKLDPIINTTDDIESTIRTKMTTPNKRTNPNKSTNHTKCDANGYGLYVIQQKII